MNDLKIGDEVKIIKCIDKDLNYSEKYKYIGQIGKVHYPIGADMVNVKFIDGTIWYYMNAEVEKV